MKYALLALSLTGCGALDLGAIVSLDDLPATLDRTASAVRIVTPSSERPIECVLGRLGADVLEGSATAIRYDAAEPVAPGIGLSYGVCLFGMTNPVVLPCKTHRALTLATGYAAELAWAVPAGLRGESSTIGGFALPTCSTPKPTPQPEDEPAPADGAIIEVTL